VPADERAWPQSFFTVSNSPDGANSEWRIEMPFVAFAVSPPPSIEEIIAETRRTYDGPLVMGEDLMSFEIGDTVSARRSQALSSPAGTAGAP
jgi:hypothetical protein